MAIPVPLYNSELQAYGVSKAVALNALEVFMRDNAMRFELISIILSQILGKDKLLTNTRDLHTTSTNALVSGLLTGNQGESSVGNAVLCIDVACAHVKALDLNIEGNRSFLNTEPK